VKEKPRIDPEERRSGFFGRIGQIFLDEERRAFIMLTVLMIILTLAAGTFTVIQSHILEHKFCQLVDASIQTPVAKPADPKANPSREKLYEDYVLEVNLDHSLGCTGAKVIK
jgi:hypothetical protein